MKKFATVLLLCIGMSLKCLSQNIYEDPSIEYIPQYFMDGSFSLPLSFEEMLDDFYEKYPVTASINHVYCQLSKVIVGVKIDMKEVDANIQRIEKHLGSDNTIYGLALIPKAIEKNENLEIILKAAEIIEDSSGDDSWEYAFALYIASTLTMDMERYGNASKSLEYAQKSLDILERGHKDSWLYPLASVNKGMARILLNDGKGLEDITGPYFKLAESIGEVDQNIFPFLHVSTNLATIYTSCGYHEEAISVAKDLDQTLYDLGFKSSELYMAANRTLCYAYAMKKDKKKAKIHYEKAEQACIERFGKGSRQYKSLQQYRTMF